MKPVTFVVKTTVVKTRGLVGSDKFAVKAEVSGYVGAAEGYSLGSTFEQAYGDAMAKMAEAVTKDDQ